ncbi:MAG: phosphatidate cytidylyltransferase, partial [bacterium]
MPDPNFVNPLLNPILYPIILRAVLVFVLGFIVIFSLKRFNFSEFKKSNLGKIYIGWIILTPIYLLGIFLGGIPALIVLFVFMYLAIKEISKIAQLPLIYTIGLIGLSLWTIFIASFFVQYFYTLPLLYFVVITGIAIKENDGENGFKYASVSLFASIWIIFALSHSILLGHLNNTLDNTKSLLLLIIFTTSLSDIGAYIFGKFFHRINFLDKYKIASNITPHKTYIGIIGHVVGAACGIWLMYFIVGNYLPIYQWVIISVLIGVFGLVGGLTNSMFKRFYKTKDSGDLIPGHGGILDRIDGI